jgi:bifunctional non-homologous end joining protein LigD
LDADRGSNRRAETQELPRTETNKIRERTKHMPPKPGRRPSSVASPPAAGALRQAVPAGQQPQLCTLLRDIPKGPTWFIEVKFDGYRFLAWKTLTGVRLMTRNGLDWAERLPAVVRWIEALGADTALLDGELVALRPDGISSFPDLQEALSNGQDTRLYFYAFDLLALEGWDLRSCTLRDRKRLLHSMDGWKGRLRFSEALEGDPGPFYQQAVRLGLEGIICKRDVPYRAARGRDWVKVKVLGREEMIVLGWTAPRGSRSGIGSLQLGYYAPDDQLYYAGAVGTGFSDLALGQWHNRLAALAAVPPMNLLVAGDPMDPTTQWVEQRYVIEVAYTAWSGAGRLRHPVHLGLREDKAPHEVVRDLADPTAPRTAFVPKPSGTAGSRARGWKAAIPPRRKPR